MRWGWESGDDGAARSSCVYITAGLRLWLLQSSFSGCRSVLWLGWVLDGAWGRTIEWLTAITKGPSGDSD